MAGRNEIKEVLCDIAAGQILYDEPMSLHTSLVVGGKADALVLVENEDQLVRIVRILGKKRKNYFTAGNMTNVIVREGG